MKVGVCFLCCLRLSRSWDWDGCETYWDFTSDVKADAPPPCVLSCRGHEAVEKVCVRSAGRTQISFVLELLLNPGGPLGEDCRLRVAWSLGLPPKEVQFLSHDPLTFLIQTQRLGSAGSLPDVLPSLGPVKVRAGTVDGFQSFRRLALQEHLFSPWFFSLALFMLSCCCCCWLRCKRRGEWFLWHAHPKAVVEGPPPDTHWRFADGKLWWKGGSTDSITEPQMFVNECDLSPRPPPVFQGDGDEIPRNAFPTGSDGEDLEAEEPRSRPETSEKSERRCAWTPAPPMPNKAVPPPVRPSNAFGAFDGRPVSSPWTRPSTPASVAPPLEVEPSLDPRHFVKQLRHLKRKTSNADRKKLFKELQLRWHPDKNVGDETRASEMFKALQENKGWFLFEDRPWSAPGVVSEA